MDAIKVGAQALLAGNTADALRTALEVAKSHPSLRAAVAAIEGAPVRPATEARKSIRAPPPKKTMMTPAAAAARFAVLNRFTTKPNLTPSAFSSANLNAQAAAEALRSAKAKAKAKAPTPTPTQEEPDYLQRLVLKPSSSPDPLAAAANRGERKKNAANAANIIAGAVPNPFRTKPPVVPPATPLFASSSNAFADPEDEKLVEALRARGGTRKSRRPKKHGRKTRHRHSV